MVRSVLMVILVSMFLSACDQNQTTPYFPRAEINSLAPNPNIAQLMNFSFEKAAPYQTVDQWELMAENTFARPKGSVVVGDVINRHPANGHPRILLDPPMINELKEKLIEDALYQSWFTDVEKEADHILDLSCVDTPLRHELQNRLLPLGLVYQLTGETKYAERAWQELEAYANFDHWNPTTQFLDIAYITKGFAIGFDWFYQFLNQQQRQKIIRAVMEKALEPVLVAYRNPTERTPYQNHKITGFDNWNSSINAGLMMVSLAICDEDGMEEICGDVLQSGIQYWENYLKELAPDGGCVEGVKYWYWGVQSVVECIAAFESATGTDYGLGKTPGLATTAYFPFYMAGPGGAFNFGNAGETIRISPELFWFARKYKDPKIAKIRRDYMEASQNPAMVYDILWYDDALIELIHKGESIPRDMWFMGNETASHRSDWGGDALFIALKGGNNMATHGHLNTGAFVLDALGERWAILLGGDRYSHPGYFRKGARNSMGYQYYRVRAEGQNTLLINPDSLSDQLPRSESRIVNFHSKDNRSFSVIDMSEAYGHEAERVIRGAMLFDGRSRILIRDEIICKKPSQVYWFMHTSAQIEISEDGRSAMLSQNGKQLLAELYCTGENASFLVLDAQPLPTSPQSEYNNPNRGIQKLTIHLEGVQKLDISVVFSPVAGDMERFDPAVLKSTGAW